MTIFTSEMIGTALLVLLGNGVVANCVLKDTKTGGGNWMVITTGWAFAVFIGVVVAAPVSGAHINPAVTIGLWAAHMLPLAQVPTYLAGQIAGAIIAGFVVWLFYKDHFAITEDQGSKRACFCTEPAIRNLPMNFVNEVIGTFLLVFVVFYLAGPNITIASDANATIGLGSLGAFPVAVLVWVIGLSLGGTTGYAINPARDFGPRLVLSVLGFLKTSPDWRYGWVPVIAPLIGGLLAASLYYVLS